MIDPKTFYDKQDSPNSRIQRSMWDIIRESIGLQERSLFSLERKSFLLGMAASFVVIIFAVGTYTSIKDAIDYSQPNIIKLDRAYQAAIHEFEKLASRDRMMNASTEKQSAMSTRKEQLQLLEKAINDLRNETSSNDLSGLKRTRLRELYGMKLKLLQEMVEQGEIEL